MLFWICIALLVWNVAPILVLWTRPGIPARHKARGTVSLIGAALKGLLVVIPSALAPFVVPLALLQTKREAEFLPHWARWWDNDVSINGDQPEGAETYYAPGHDRRSFWARYVWLGWRNRASHLALILGHRWNIYTREYDDSQSWGDPGIGRDTHGGWVVNRRGSVYQMYAIKKVGKLCLRLNFGHKVWSGAGDKRPVANVVNIALTVLPWRGVA